MLTCELLKQYLDELELELTNDKVELLIDYGNIVLEKNHLINLTSIKQPHEFIIKHIIDCLALFRTNVRIKGKIVDIGTGAGFPAVPLAIVAEQASILAIDSVLKRVNFLHEALSQLEITNITPFHGRAEDLGHDKCREQYDLSISRAVANLPVLMEFCVPFVKVNGLFIAMKGSNVHRELESSFKAMEQLGIEYEDRYNFFLPENMGERNILFFRKSKPTPDKYPRRPGKPHKSPIS